MSKVTDDFEIELTRIINNFSQKTLPKNLPEWVQRLGIDSSTSILNSIRIGAAGHKTDVIVNFNNGKKLKISAKLSNADYFGNWYSHKKIINNFGLDVFQKLTIDCTKWANDWIKHDNASMFVGVSVSFGKRTGNTLREFLEVFDSTDIIKIVAGTGTGDEIANCLYSSSSLPRSLEELFEILQPINSHTIQELSRNFKVIYRPVNPLTEGTNRGKCSYTQFIPFKRLPSQTNIDNLIQLRDLGNFGVVNENNLNHNKILDELRDTYNFIIPRKAKVKSKK